MKKTLLLTAATAFAARALFAITLVNSPLRTLNTLPGLDMATLLGFSEWNSGCHDSLPMFVLHRFLLFFCYLISGMEHNFFTIYVVQSLFGIAGAVFCAWGMFRLCKDTRCAAISGIIYAVYSPFLLYESVALQESVLVHTFTIALALLIAFSNAEKDAAVCGVLAGVMLGVNSSGRPSTAFAAVAMITFAVWQSRKNNRGTALILPFCGLFSIWLTASVFNGFFRGNFSPFFNVMPHLLDLHNPEPALSAGVPAEPGNSALQYLRVLWGAVRNTPHIFGMREIPENLDYNIISREFPVLFAGPHLLMAFAVAGVISCALLKRKYTLILYVAIASCALPLSARLPIGRYRLILAPVFIWFAALLVNELICNKEKRVALCAVLIGVTGTNLLLDNPLVRQNPAAYHTLALASEKCGNNDDYVKYLNKAYFAESNCRYKPSGLLLTLHHLKKGDFGTAEKVILSDQSKAPEFTYYLALIRTSQNRFREAELLLLSLDKTVLPDALRAKSDTLKHFLSAKLLEKK